MLPVGVQSGPHGFGADHRISSKIKRVFTADASRISQPHACLIAQDTIAVHRHVASGAAPKDNSFENAASVNWQ
jgi:hypothetical protein